ncbi:MAG: hypothetical protein VB085_08955 [Peptococcaceae bacterium]|nr:hypothetical protein [Peptococcaceae bacterium]
MKDLITNFATTIVTFFGYLLQLAMANPLFTMIGLILILVNGKGQVKLGRSGVSIGK